MLNTIIFQQPYLFLAVTALLVNVPLGFIRENYPRYSLKWLFWIHASIPLIIYLRLTLDIPNISIPVSIFLAVAGQLLGGWWRRKYMSLEDRERLSQIPETDDIGCKRVLDSDVTVVLLNMGGPRTNVDVRDFQKRLFSDPLLIRFPLSWVFQRLFASILVALRTKKAEKRYRLIGGGSPIYNSTRDQARVLREELSRRGRTVDVTFSFNYSPPLPAETMRNVKECGKKYLLPLSLYPHYSKATTGSSIYYLKQAAKIIDLHIGFLNSPRYYLHEGYITAFTDRILEQVLPGESLDDFYLIFSAHSLPLYLLTEGDPYPFEVSQTVAKILAHMKRTDRWVIAYQSAVGPLQWIKPATEDMIKALAERGVKKLIIVPISFVTDHIETTCEINIECRKIAERSGIVDFRMSKAIECHPGFIRAMADSVERVLQDNRGGQEQPGSNNSEILTNL